MEYKTDFDLHENYLYFNEMKYDVLCIKGMKYTQDASGIL